MSERAVRLTVTGRVQGVGYRAWVQDEAEARGLDGWVRNRKDGSVEAAVAGSGDEVAALIAACRVGPRGAVVVAVDVADYAGPRPRGFTVLPTTE